MKDNQANNMKNASYKVYNRENISGIYGETIMDLHNNGFIHIHDLEYTGVGFNCLAISLEEYLENRVKRLEKNYYYDFEDILDFIFECIVRQTNEQSGGIGFIAFDKELVKYTKGINERELEIYFRRFFKRLNLPLRKGFEKPYVTFNIGLESSEEGRKIMKSMLNAFLKGDLEGKAFLFPNIVFKLKKGVNLEEGDPNYDIFKLATFVTSQRMNPTYFNCDSQLVSDIDSQKSGIMGCRTLVGANKYGENGGKSRGNIGCVSLNLPKIADSSKDEKDFFKNLDSYLELGREILEIKYRELERLKIEDFSFIADNNLYMGIKNSTKVGDFLKNGTLSIGFMGLFDCISKLKKEDIDIAFIERNIEFGEKIMKFISEKIGEWNRDREYNFSFLATAGEGISSKFAKNDNKDYYTNSYHIPVYIEIDGFKKLEIESVFSKYCNGGSISYVEFSAIPINNSQAVEDIVRYGVSKDLSYIGINFPLDICNSCGEKGTFIKNICPHCGNSDIISIRRVSGYLSNKSELKSGKKEEERDRKGNM